MAVTDTNGMNKDYLGDGVYVTYDGYHLVLSTENGVDTTNTIYLEPAVLAALDRYRLKAWPGSDTTTTTDKQ